MIRLKRRAGARRYGCDSCRSPREVEWVLTVGLGGIDTVVRLCEPCVLQLQLAVDAREVGDFGHDRIEEFEREEEESYLSAVKAVLADEGVK